MGYPKQKEAIRMVRKAKRVYVGTCLTPEDVIYVQAVKADVIWNIRELEGSEFKVVLRDDGDVYIN